MNNKSKQTDPLQDLFADVKKILDFMEVKDLKEALKYETPDIKSEAEKWMAAKLQEDSYITYKDYWNIAMFQEVVSNTRLKDINYWMNNPFNVPMMYRDNLLEKGREAFLLQYEEKNDYYRMLNGLPPIGTPKSEFIYLTEPMRNQLHASTDPVHLLSPLIQNNYMGTDEYKQVLANNPDKTYLKYMGLYKIDIFTARHAKDFEIIRYPLNRSDVNPNLVNQFSSLYSDYREYVMAALYNPHLEDIYVNYRTFMGVLIMIMTLMQINNKALEALNNKNFLDDSILHILLSMYDIPSSLLLTNEVRRNLVINLPKLIKEKGTKEVYYDLINVLGYQDVKVSKLLLMKGQKFDKNNNYKATDEVEPYFIQVDLQDKNPYETITSGKAPIHDYHKIIDDDPTWWDIPDTRRILKNASYSMADSKYIIVEAVIHQMKYLFESIYFPRMIFDNKDYTDTFMIEIPEIFGTEMVSIYDLMVFVVAAMCMNNGLSGDISFNDSLRATAGFNFNMDLDSFEEYVQNCEYVDKDKIMAFMEDLTMRNTADINRLYNDIMYPMREWLEHKIAKSVIRKEFIEYESIYRALFTYDASYNNFLSDFKKPLEIICEKYGITDEEILAYKHFYPRITNPDTRKVERVTTDIYNESYNGTGEGGYTWPFLSRINMVDWYIPIILQTPYGTEDRGNIYFHDILNSDNICEVANPDGTRPLMDYEDEDVGWAINWQAVEMALDMLEHLDEEDLHGAVFQTETSVQDGSGKRFMKGEKLPANIRTGLYKEILREKVRMDVDGLSEPPDTYLEYLRRKNEKLYNFLIDGDRFNLDREGWLNDVLKIILAVETELNIHMKYFEQSVVGSDLFFKPLITLIKHFKSTYVNFAKTGFSYVFTDKIDAGGNSNMLKLFDEMKLIVHFVTLANRGYLSQLGLYDTEYKVKHHIIMKDRSQQLKMNGNEYDVNTRDTTMGSIHLVDEVKFFKNGVPLDPVNSVYKTSRWQVGEEGVGK